MPQSQEEFYFSLPYDRMDLCLYAVDHGLPPEAIAAAVELDVEQVERVFADIAAKRRVARTCTPPPSSSVTAASHRRTLGSGGLATMIIRPLQPEDAAQVASLWQYWFRGRTRTPDAGLVELVHRLYFERPGADPEVTSLVADDGAGKLLGIAAVCPHPSSWMGRCRPWPASSRRSGIRMRPPRSPASCSVSCCRAPGADVQRRWACQVRADLAGCSAATSRRRPRCAG
jgi:hypothetical protein